MADTFRVKVRAFRVEGATAIAAEELQALLAELVGRELSFRDLRAAAEKLAGFYRARGYFLSQVLIPPQDVTDGSVTLRVLEGKLAAGDAAIPVTGQLRLSPEVVRGILRSAIGEGGALRRTDLERGILLLNDLPGVSASVTVEPGSEPGTATLATAVREPRLIRGGVSLDNVGSRFTGRNRAGLNASLEDPMGRGDRLSAALMTAVDGKFDYGRFAYALPVGSSGLRLEAAYSALGYTAGRELASIASKGDAKYGSLNARYPLVRSRVTNVWLSGGYEEKRSTSEARGVNVTDKRVWLLPLGLAADHLDDLWGGGASSVSAGVAAGRLDLSRNAGSLAGDAAGPGTQGSFAKALYGFTRVQSVTGTTVLQFSANGQATDKNLDSSEKFSIGGPVGVRAYPAGEGLGDSGVVASAELRTVVARGLEAGGMNLGDVQLAAFIDAGRVRQFHSLWAGAALTGPNAYTLKGAGVGVNMGSAGNYDLRLYWATKIGGNPGATATGADNDGSRGRSRVTLLLNAYF